MNTKFKHRTFIWPLLLGLFYLLPHGLLLGKESINSPQLDYVTSPYFHSVAISEDNRLIAGLSEDRSICIWELQSGKLAKILPPLPGFSGHFSPHGDVIDFFSSDSEYLIYFNSRTFVLWDAKTWKQIRSDSLAAFKSHFRWPGLYANQYKYCDGSILIVEDDSLFVFSLAGYPTFAIARDESTYKEPYLSDGGRYLSVLDNNGTLEVYGSDGSGTGKLVYSSELSSILADSSGNLVIAPNLPLTVSQSGVNVGFFLKGNRIALVNQKSSAITMTHPTERWSSVYSYYDQKTLCEFNDDESLMAMAIGSSIFFTDVTSGITRSDTVEFDVSILDIELSHDGAILAISTFGLGVQVWDTKNFSNSKTLGNDYPSPVVAMGLEENGRTLVTLDEEKKIRRWDIVNGNQEQFPREFTIPSIPEDSTTTPTLARHIDGNYRTLHINDLQDFTISGSGRYFACIEFEDTYLGESSIHLFDSSFKHLATFKDSVYKTTLRFHPNGNSLVFGDSNGTISLATFDTSWTIETLVRDPIQFGNQGETDEPGYERNGITSISFSPDSKYVCATNGYYSIGVWETESNTRIALLDCPYSFQFIKLLAISADNNYLMAHVYDEKPLLWDLRSREQVPLTSIDYDVHLGAATFTSDGRFLTVGDDDGVIHFLNLENSSDERTINTRSGIINSIVYSQDGRFIYVATEKGGIQRRDSQNGELIATAIAFNDDEWMMYGQDMYYNSSPNIESHVIASIEGKVLSAHELSSSFRSADMLQRGISKVNQTNIPVLKVFFRNHEGDGSLIPVRDTSTKNDELHLDILAIDYLDAIDSVVIKRNSIRLPQVHTSEKSTNELHIKDAYVLLAEAYNQIEILAYNSKGRSSDTVTFAVTYEPDVDEQLSNVELVDKYYPPKRNWAVLIGVGKYPLNSGLDTLAYPINDVDSLKQCLISTMDYLPSQIFVLKDSSATKGHINSLIQDTILNIIGTEDRLLVYFSGHGLIDSTKYRKRKSFGIEGLLVPYNGIQSAPSTCISTDDIYGSWANKSVAKQTLFIIDACFSGQMCLSEKGDHLDPANESRADIVDGLMTGAKEVLTAGGADIKVPEDKSFGGGHSGFTFYLIKGLRGSADLSKDGVISSHELVEYLKREIRNDTRFEAEPKRCDLQAPSGRFIFRPKTN